MSHVWRKRLSQAFGQDPVPDELIARLDVLASEEGTLLLTGGRAVTREAVARGIHLDYRKPALAFATQAGGPFVAWSFASQSPRQIEAALWGAGTGDFNDYAPDASGMLVAAGAGTLFVDCLESCPVQIQERLAETMGEGELRHRRGGRVERVECRLILGTEHLTEQLLGQGRLSSALQFALRGEIALGLRGNGNVR